MIDIRLCLFQEQIDGLSDMYGSFLGERAVSLQKFYKSGVRNAFLRALKECQSNLKWFNINNLM